MKTVNYKLKQIFGSASVQIMELHLQVLLGLKKKVCSVGSITNIKGLGDFGYFLHMGLLADSWRFWLFLGLMQRWMYKLDSCF